MLHVSWCRISFVLELLKKEMGYKLILYWHYYCYSVLKIKEHFKGLVLPLSVGKHTGNTTLLLFSCTPGVKGWIWARWLWAPTVLREDLSLVPSTHTDQLTAARNLSFRRIPWSLLTSVATVFMFTQINRYT